ncbi:MAG TPA: ATP-binding protein [Gemmatimonadaceae bacterium]|nr:ATP-binding protein [Gemmatimonadaceae bacterium]
MEARLPERPHDPPVRAGAGDAYLCTDALGTILDADDALLALLGRPRARVIGRSLTSFLSPEDRDRLRVRLARAVEDGSLAVRLHASPDEGRPVLLAPAITRHPSSTSLEVHWLVRPGAEDDLIGESPPELDPEPRNTRGRRTAFLAAVSGLLARSFDYERTLASLATFALPILGDWCIVDVLDDAEHVRRLAVAVLRDERHLALRIRERVPMPNDPTDPIGHVLCDGTPVLRVSPTTTDLRAVLGDEPGGPARPMWPRSLLAVPLTARDHVLGVLTFLMADSGRRHCPADLSLASELAARAALLADNARLYREAEQANRVKSDFLAAMSHELRTPLTAIMGYGELLSEGIVGPVTPLQREQLRRIRASSDHLLGIVEQILTFARVEAGREAVTMETVDAAALVEQAVTVFGPQTAAKGLSFEVSQPETPVFVTTDLAKVRQAIVNLLANAVKFTAAGSVGVTLSADDSRAYIEVWDTGIGIPAEHLERIFEPFWQVQQSSTRLFGGTGLGLSLVRRLIRLLGGDVSVRSVQGEGSRFTITLPRAEQNGGDEGVHAQE